MVFSVHINLKANLIYEDLLNKLDYSIICGSRTQMD